MTTPTGAGAAQERNAAAVDRLETEAAVPVRAAISAMLAAVLDANTGTETVAPVPDTLAAAARRAWAAAKARILDWVRTTFRRLLTRAVGNLPEDLAPDVPAATVEQRVQSLVDQIAAGLDHVPDLVAARITRELGDGYAAGDTPQQLRERVARVLGRDEWDPEVVRIARTTTTSVYNAAHTAAADDLEVTLGRPLPRLWIATNDSRTRPSHRKASGQIAESGERFRVGDALLRFPGDPLGPPEEIINCRCVVTPVVDDFVVDLAHRVRGREAAVLDTDEPLAASGVLTAEQRWLVAAMIAVSRIPPQLLVYWTRGEGAAKIRWGTKGDFNRCRRQLRKYVNPAQLNGLCANLHHAALGVWPGQEGEADAAAVAAGDESEDAMPCPCENMTDEEITAAVAAIAAGVSGDPDLRIAARDTEWDGDAAADRVREWATDRDTIDPDRYGRAFFWRDPDADPTTQVAYKLGFADVIDGDLFAIPAGIFAVASVLEGGRGGVDIPESDMDAVRGRVSHYYTRMASEFDDENLVAPWDREDAEAASMADAGTGDSGGEVAAAADGAAVTAATLEDAFSGGMIALVPSEQDAGRLVVDGDTALPVDELHVTLAFLGPGEPWLGTPQAQAVQDLAARIAGDVGPITVRVWAVGVANPDSDEPAAMYLVGDDTGLLAAVQGGVTMALAALNDTGDEGEDTDGGEGVTVPPPHSPFVAHISTRYGDPSLEGMDQTGTDVVLDRIRVSFADDVTDYPLTGDNTLDLVDDEDTPEDTPEVDPEPPAASEDAMPEDMTASATAPSGAARPAAPDGAATAGPAWAMAWPGAVVAVAAAKDNTAAVLAQAASNAPERPPAAWFEPVRVDGPTPPTVTAQGRVWGHIGQAGVCHVGITDECVTIPPTRTNFGAFHRGELVADDGTDDGVTVRVGYLYTGCDHSPMDATIDQARGYLDSACTRTAAGRVYDTEWGPMFVGTLLPGVTAGDVARLWKLSGEWFTAPLELHAAVGVEDAGFPVDGTSPDGVLVSDEDPEPAATAVTAGAAVVDVAGVVAAHRARAAARETSAVVHRTHRARRDRAAAVVAGYTKRG